jgi:hypothetical protein
MITRETKNRTMKESTGEQNESKKEMIMNKEQIMII